jgi:hypothetical protein
MDRVISETAVPWLRDVFAALGMTEGDREVCVEQAGVVLGDVPISWGPTLTGGDTQLMAQAVVGEVGPPDVSAPVLEAVLHTQLLLCGPAMPVFGLDSQTRSLVLMHVFSPERDAPADAVTVLRAMQRIARDARPLLGQPVS